jgi:hypothetical protein
VNQGSHETNGRDLALTMVKAGLQAVPGFGSALATVIDDAQGRSRRRVVDTALASLQASTTPEALVDALRRSKQLADLFLDVMEAASRQASASHRRVLGLVVAMAASGAIPFDEAQLAASTIASMTEAHAAALSHLASVAEPDYQKEGLATEARRWPEPVLAGLIRLGLATPATFVGGGLGVFSITDHGRRVLEMLSGEDPEASSTSQD